MFSGGGGRERVHLGTNGLRKSLKVTINISYKSQLKDWSFGQIFAYWYNKFGW